MVLVSFCLPLQLSAQNTETFTSNGTFTVPPGVTQITVQAWGGGGGGADRSTNYSGERYGGGGGGGGGFASGVLLVSAGDVITITVGNGGEGGSSNGVNGGSGGNTIVSHAANAITAEGGAGGTTSNNPTGGIGGGASFTGLVNSQLSYQGGSGADGTTDNGGGGGGGAGSIEAGSNGTGTTGGLGGANDGGNGGVGSTDGSAGGNGSLYGAGGGGSSDNNNSVGGSGANGQVLISYIPTYPYLSVSPSSIDFGYVASGGTSIVQTYTLSGANLTGFPNDIEVTAPSNFQVSTNGTDFFNSVDVEYTSAILSATPIYVRFTPSTPNIDYSDNITHDGGGSPALNLLVEGTSTPHSYCDANSTEPDIYESITNVTFAGINNSSPVIKSVGYTDYSSSVSPGSVVAGQTYPISITEQFIDEEFGGYCKVFIDYNQNGTFDLPDEIAFESSYTNNMTMTGNITIPLSASLGTTRMRIVLQGDGDSGTTDPCGDFEWGEVEDYSLIIKSPTSPGIILSKSNIDFGFWPVGSTSSEESYTVSGINLSPSSGIISINAPANFEISTSSGSDFGSSVSLPYSGSSLTATPIYVVFKPTTVNIDYSGEASHNGGSADEQVLLLMGSSVPNYCSAGSNNCTWDGSPSEHISRVQVGDIDNSSACTTGGYVDYTSLSTDMEIGQNYTITVTNGAFWSGDQCGIWIDWNANGSFYDDNAIVVSGGPDVFTANISPPAGAVLGSVTMRIRIAYIGDLEPCGTVDWGEVEDYTINVLQSCTPPDVPTLSATSSAICFGESTTLSIASGSLNDANYWQWYSASCGGTAIGQGSSMTVSPSATTTYYARGEGSCDGLTCGSITITVNRFAVEVVDSLDSDSCPEFLDPFNPNNDGPYNPGSTELIFRVNREYSSQDWNFDFKIEDVNDTIAFEVLSVTVTEEQTTTNVTVNPGIDDSEGAIEDIDVDYVVIKARIKNIMGYRLETQLSVFNASDSNNCSELPADESDNEVIHTILPMPVIGEFD